MFDINHIVASGGLLLIAALIFGESGMFIGFFFPGDTLLISAGVFAAAGKISLLSIIIVAAIAAIVGDNVGYHIGKRYGRRLFSKPDGVVFKQEYIVQAESFYDRFGSKTMLFAHFIPVVRTFAPATAGAGKMNYRHFMAFDAIGDTAWTIVVTLVGYYFGSKIHNLDHYILLAVLIVVLATLGPAFYNIGKAYTQKRRRKTALETKSKQLKKE